MKKFYKLISLLVSIMMVIMLLPVQIAKAATTPDGVFTYEVSGGNAEITGLVDRSYSGSITLPSTISDASNTFTVTSIGSNAFNGCKGLTGTLTIPDSVTSIGVSAFEGCKGLTGLTIGNSVTTIGEGAFAGCVNLTGNLTIPDSVTTIGESAFSNCNGLTGPLTIPDSVTSLGNYAFSSCSGLTGPLTIPDSVTSIGNHVFGGCSGLTGPLTIPDSVTSIGEWAFYGCSGLTGPLTIPNSVTTIGELAFYGCSGLTGPLTIPDSVTSIGNFAFQECGGLTGPLTIPDSVPSIGEQAFYQCSGLTSLTIGNGVTSIGDSAFANCSGLTGLTIGNSVTSIGQYAFGNCRSINTIVAKAVNTPSVRSDTFIGVPLTAVLYTPNTPADNTSYDVLPWSNFVRSSGYEVTFDSNGGSTVDLQTVDYNTIATEPAQPTKTGYTFAGWYTDEALTESFDFNTPITENITLYAKWTPELKTVTFDSNDGSAVDPQTVDYNTLATEPAQPTKTGYTFAGWYTDEALTESFDFNTPITENITLYAKWTPELRTVTFDSNDGSAVDPQTVDYNTLATEPAQPTKTGYTFAGWYTDEALTESFEFNAPITENITLYAKWDPEPVDTVISGTNRFDTAALISKQLYDSADTVILTTGRNFPDALSAGPLAVQLDAPILLSKVSQIPTETLAEIIRLGARRVIILGGQMAIDPSVEETLLNQGLTVERISGDNRFLTAIEVAKKVRASSGQLEKAILVNGYGFADALSIGSKAAKAGIPILLTSPGSLSPKTKEAMVEFGIKEIEIIGGDLAVSEAVEDELAGMGIRVTRISGSNRYGTSATTAGEYFANSQNAIIATGLEFADALAAVPLAVHQDAPILLAKKDTLPTEISNYLGGSTVNNITIVGGEIAVSSEVRNEILNVLKK